MRMAHPKDPPTAYASSVRSARLAAGLTQQALASLLGLAASTLYRIEQGHEPSDVIRRRLDAWMRRRAKAA